MPKLDKCFSFSFFAKPSPTFYKLCKGSSCDGTPTSQKLGAMQLGERASDPAAKTPTAWPEERPGPALSLRERVVRGPLTLPKPAARDLGGFGCDLAVSLSKCCARLFKALASY